MALEKSGNLLESGLYDGKVHYPLFFSISLPVQYQEILKWNDQMRVKISWPAGLALILNLKSKNLKIRTIRVASSFKEYEDGRALTKKQNKIQSLRRRIPTALIVCSEQSSKNGSVRK